MKLKNKNMAAIVAVIQVSRGKGGTWAMAKLATKPRTTFPPDKDSISGIMLAILETICV